MPSTPRAKKIKQNKILKPTFIYYFYKKNPRAKKTKYIWLEVATFGWQRIM